MQRHIFYVPGLMDARVVKAAKLVAVAQGAKVLSESRGSFLIEISQDKLAPLIAALPDWKNNPEHMYRINPPRARVASNASKKD